MLLHSLGVALQDVMVLTPAVADKAGLLSQWGHRTGAQQACGVRGGLRRAGRWAPGPLFLGDVGRGHSWTNAPAQIPLVKQYKTHVHSARTAQM